MTATPRRAYSTGAAFLLCAALAAGQTHPAPAAPPTNKSQQPLPDGPGKETVQKLCGTCHSANIVLGRGMTREEWSEVVSSMISRGAKGTQDEFTQVIEYLARTLPPNAAPGAAAASPRRGGGGGFTVGPDDKQIVDASAADKGKTIYDAQCANCHGAKARGAANGPDLVRSLIVLHDRYGSTLGPFLAKPHPQGSAAKTSGFTQAEIEQLSHFLHQMPNDTLRSGPYSKVLNVLTGDPKAGEAYFNGAGGCNKCHSATGDLAKIASRYDPPTLQQRFLFPWTVAFGPKGMTRPKPVTITVRTPAEADVSGTLDRIDDFEVSLVDAKGDYHSWKRTPEMIIEKHNPYAGHIELLDQYTDKDIHDVVAYLETLK